MRSCNCDRGYFLCPTAVALWAETNRQYEVGRRTGDYSHYEAALVAYDRHFAQGLNTEARR